MENKLKALFEFQRFSPNERLAKMIEETEQGVSQLDDDELSLVSAAGEICLGQGLPEKEKQPEEKN